MKKAIAILLVLLSIPFLYSNQQDEKNIKVIKDYYQYLSNRETLKKAYELSPKKVSYDKYYSWYKDVTEIKLSRIVLLTNNEYTFIVTLIENINGKKEVTLFDVTMTIEKSKIRSSMSKRIKCNPDRKIVVNEDLKEKLRDIYSKDLYDAKNDRIYCYIIGGLDPDMDIGTQILGDPRDYRPFLHTAVRTNNMELLLLLLKYNADINHLDGYSYNALQQLCRNIDNVEDNLINRNMSEFTEIAEILLRNGIDMHGAEGEKSALELAKESLKRNSSYQSIIALLEKYEEEK